MGLTLVSSQLQVLLSHLWEKKKEKGKEGRKKGRKEGREGGRKDKKIEGKKRRRIFFVNKIKIRRKKK